MITTYLLLGIIYTLINAKTVKNMFESKGYQNYEKMLDGHHKIGKFLKNLTVIEFTLALVALWPVLVIAFDVVPRILICINRSKAEKMYLKLEKVHDNTVNFLDSELTEFEDLTKE